METLTQTAPDVLAEIKSANREFEKTFANSDAQGMASLYTADGMLLPAGAGIQKGPEAIRNFWQMVMDMGIKKAKLETQELEHYDNAAVELGQYELSDADGQRMDEGKYIVIWKKQDGNWKLDKDIWNTSLSNS